MIWPPDLDDLKTDMRLPLSDTKDDRRLQDELDAALAEVARVHAVRYNLDGDPMSSLPTPDAAMALGTVRLASRWFTRGRSPDGLIQAGELGATRVTSGDQDIDRQLQLGRFAVPVIA